MYTLTILHILIMLLSSNITKAAPLADAVCCPPGYTFFPRNFTCRDQITNTSMHISLAYNQTVAFTASDTMKFIFDDNGQLLLKVKNREPIIYAPGSFCISTRTTTNKDNVTKTKLYAVVSYEADSDVRVIEESIRGYCMIVSTFFFYATAVVYACRPEIRTAQGLSIINLCLSLGTGLGVLAIVVLMPYSDMVLCAVRGFLVYFFLTVSFFWMNVISLQTLRSSRCSQRTSDRVGRQYLWYAAYAWGFPAGLTIYMAIVNFMPGDHLKPGIGLNHCWFYGIAKWTHIKKFYELDNANPNFVFAPSLRQEHLNPNSKQKMRVKLAAQVLSHSVAAGMYCKISQDTKQQWIYMYSVMTILIAVNISIFVYVTYRLWFNSALTQGASLRYKMLMTMRLFIVTGVPWVHEIISSLTPHNVVWEVMDILNSLQGVSIFFVMLLFPLLLAEEGGKFYDLNIDISPQYTKIFQ